MFTNIWRTLMSLFAFGLVTLSAANAFAQRGLSDSGEFFDKQHEQQAVKLINDLHSRHGKDVRIETFAKVPDGRADRLKQVGTETFFKDWLKERAQAEHVNGVFVLICRQPAMIKVGVNESTRKSTFSDQDREALWKLIKRRFDNKQFDEGLIDGLKYIQDRFAAHATSSATVPNKAQSEPRTSPIHSRPEQRPQPEQEGVGIMGWIIFGGIVLIAFLVIRALFRAMSGGGASGSGTGPMMGGGGGWGSSFLSGLFGAAAGSYLYDSFFRGHASSNWGQSASAAEPHATGDSGAASQEEWSVNDGGSFNDPDSGPAEFDGDDSGGDFGGGDFGGGDFGGGGDDF